jgi:hypothetical protein
MNRPAILLVFLRSELQLLVTANYVPSSMILFSLMMVAIRSSETSVLIRATRRDIPEDGILHSHRCETLKSYLYGIYCFKTLLSRSLSPGENIRFFISLTARSRFLQTLTAPRICITIIRRLLNEIFPVGLFNIILQPYACNFFHACNMLQLLVPFNLIPLITFGYGFRL